MSKDILKYLPDLVSAGFKHDNSTLESAVITIIRILNKSSEDKKIVTQLSDILGKHQSGTLEKNKFSRSFTALQNDNSNDYFKIIRPQVSLSEIEIDIKTKRTVVDVISSYKKKELLLVNNINYIKKVLITGKPGTGKTSIGQVISSELNLPLYYVNISMLFSSYLGNSAKNLGSLFDQMSNKEAVFLFDEFDSLAISRTKENEVGEMRRIVNSILTFLERWEGNGIIIATSNETTNLDEAIWRRFDVKLQLGMPEENIRFKLISRFLGEYVSSNELKVISKMTEGYTPAELELLAQNSIRTHLLNDTPVFLRIVQDVAADSLTKKDKILVSKLLNEHITYREIGETLGISKSTVARYVKEEG